MCVFVLEGLVFVYLVCGGGSSGGEGGGGGVCGDSLCWLSDRITITATNGLWCDMKAKVCINGELLAEDINMESGLRQGCTMAPVLLNLYACLVFKRRSSRVADMDGVRTLLPHKFHQALQKVHQECLQESAD